MKKKTHIVFSGGGTGGHLFPGLAVAEQLLQRLPEVRITFAGSGKEFERRHVTKAGFEYFAVPCRPLPRRASEAIPFVVENFAGYLTTSRFVRDEAVDAVVGLGGYASVPMGRAAARYDIPLVLLEQNVVLGKANRWLSRSANLICTSFEPTQIPNRPGCSIRWTGNPIRNAPDPRSKRSQSRHILILGGSGGARSLNENVPRALYKIRESLAGWRILHQTGEADVETTRELYRKFALDANVAAFWTNLPEVMAESSVAVCRAGGTTLAELAAAAVPAVLLPYPHATDDHQRRNAEIFVTAGGSLMVDERDLSGRLDDDLAEAISGIVIDARRRELMSDAMSGLARPDAAGQVASLVWSLVSSKAVKRKRAAV